MEPAAGQRDALQLRYRTGSNRGRIVSFAGPQVRIGRSRDNDWVLSESESPASSGHHAEARLEHGAWWLFDLDSTNGTWVNDRAVSQQRLRRGDRIRFGPEPVLEVLSGALRTRSIVPAAIALALALAALAIWWRTRSEAGFESMVQSAARSVYLVAVERDGERRALATAFAVRRPGVLATSAHVVLELRRLGALPPGGLWRGVAVRGDSAGAGLGLRGARVHPNYRQGQIGFDAALLYIEPDPQLAPLALESLARVEQLRRGTALAALGFPQDATDPQRPRARLTVDTLGDRRGRFLVVQLGIAPGTSGSPILTPGGRVIGIVTAGNFDASPGSFPQGSHWGLTIHTLVDLLRDRPAAAVQRSLPAQ
ncbi:MAG TPA: FHA domain-containing protein [Acidobacteriota bacterium]